MVLTETSSVNYHNIKKTTLVVVLFSNEIKLQARHKLESALEFMEFWIDSMSVLRYPCLNPNTMLLGKVRVNFSSLSLSSLSSLSRLSTHLGKLAIYSLISYNFTADKDIDLKLSGYVPWGNRTSFMTSGITLTLI